MTISNITTGQQTVTATGAVTPTAGLDVSGITGDFTIHLRVQGLTVASGNNAAVIQIEGTTNAFTASTAVIVKQVKGPINAPGSTPVAPELHFSWRKYELPESINTYIGQTNGKLRANVTQLDGTTPSLVLDSWVES